MKFAFSESFYRLTLMGAAVISVLSLTTLFDQAYWVIEQFVHFKVQYALCALIASLVFLAYKKWIFAFSLFLVCVINGLFIVPWYLSTAQIPSTEKPVNNSSNKTLTIIHTNVYKGNNDFGQFLAMIDQHQPDVVVVQELTSAWLPTLTSLKSHYPASKLHPREDAFGIGLLSKKPLSQLELKFYNPDDFPSIEAALALGSQTITLIATHPMAPMNRALKLMRNKQLLGIGKAIEKIQTPIIVIGDLNISPWSHVYQDFIKTSRLVNTRKGFGIAPTWPVFLPIAGIPIDHCIVSPAFNVHSFTTLPSIGSDHLPIKVVLSL